MGYCYTKTYFRGAGMDQRLNSGERHTFTQEIGARVCGYCADHHDQLNPHRYHALDNGTCQVAMLDDGNGAWKLCGCQQYRNAHQPVTFANFTDTATLAALAAKEEL
jgi:hypothetical protein